MGLAAAIGRHSLHPVSRAIAAAAGPGSWAIGGVQEFAGQGLEAQVRSAEGGAARLVRLGSALLCGAPPSTGSATEVHLADDDGWLATFMLHETLREHAVATVRQLAAQGLQVELLSGDREAAVARVAARAGIGRWLGAQSPRGKLERVAGLQQQGLRVAMVGDGLNDGPVLARADLSFAMGQGAPLAQSRSDVVVPGGRLDAVPTVLAQARRTQRVVRQNLAWAAAYNAVCVPLALAGWMPPWLAGLGMAASSLLVVANAARLSRLPAESPQG
jgi:Cu2+-exporting ATPase